MGVAIPQPADLVVLACRPAFDFDPVHSAARLGVQARTDQNPAGRCGVGATGAAAVRSKKAQVHGRECLEASSERKRSLNVPPEHMGRLPTVL